MDKVRNLNPTYRAGTENCCLLMIHVLLISYQKHVWQQTRIVSTGLVCFLNMFLMKMQQTTFYIQHAMG